MILRLSAAAHRRRVPILLVAAAVTASVLVAVGLGVAAEAAAVVLTAILFMSLILGVIVVFSALRPGQARPAFVVDERDQSLRTPRNGGLALLGVTMLAALGIGLIVPDDQADLGFPAWTISVFAAVILAVCARATLTGIGLTIGAEGLRADKFAGSVVVPWDAIDPGQIWSGPFEVHLRFHAPELVRTTGWVVNPGKLRVDGVVPEFAAATIQHYAGSPAERVLIGAPAGQLHPSARVVVSPKIPGLGNPGAVVAVLVLSVLTAVGAVVVDLRVGAELGNSSVAGIAAHLLTVALVLLALRLIKGSVILLRRRG